MKANSNGKDQKKFNGFFLREKKNYREAKKEWREKKTNSRTEKSTREYN